MDLQGRHVVVTGGSRGIGKDLAERFAAAGARVLVVARNAAQLEEVAGRIGGEFLAADLLDPDVIDGLVPACIAKLGHVDVWINNAGLAPEDAFVQLPPSEIRSLVRLNVEGTMLLTHAIAGYMVERGAGHIVQLSSVAGTIPFPGLAAYAGTKAAVTNFSETLRLELKGTGVGLTIVAPGPTATDMWEQLETDDAYSKPALDRFRHLLYLPKLDSGDVADATVAAVQAEKRFVRMPKRYAPYHLLNNAPRRLVELAITGVRSPKLRPYRAEPPAFEPLWATDNPPSRDFPLYTRGNVGEVFPEVVLPLTWDLYGKAAEDGWREGFEDLGLVVDGDLSADEDMVVLSVFGGYCYLNASLIRLLGVRAPGGTVEAIDSIFFGESDAPAYAPRPGDKSLRSSARLAKTVLKLLRTTTVPGLDDDKATVRAYLAARPDDDATDDALLGHITDLTPLFQQLFRRHIVNTFSVALVSGAVSDLLAKVDRADDLTTILGGIGGVESAAPSAAMWDLARTAQAEPALAAAFDQGVSGLLDRVADVPGAATWLGRFDTFLDEFGSRGPNEWDLSSDPWAFRPELALAAIDRMRGADENHAPLAQQARLAAERDRVVAEVRAALSAIDRFQFDKALAATTAYSQARECSKTTVIRAIQSARRAHAVLAERIAERGGPETRFQACLLGLDDFTACLKDAPSYAALAQERVARHAELAGKIPPFIVEGTVPDLATWADRGGASETATAGTVLRGIAGCPGVARGRARVVLDAGDPGDLGPGDVLVAPITDPSWTPLFLAAEAVVVDVGATMSHAVIVSRELGIPCVVSAVGATTSIPDGALLEVDGSKGTVTVVELP